MSRAEQSVGERALWCAVVYQGLRDALRPQDCRDRDTARAWIDAAGPDFVAVCRLAGVNPPALRDLYRRLRSMPREDWPEGLKIAGTLSSAAEARKARRARRAK